MQALLLEALYLEALGDMLFGSLVFESFAFGSVAFGSFAFGCVLRKNVCCPGVFAAFPAKGTRVPYVFATCCA